MEEKKEGVKPDKFDISFRVLGNEILGMSMESQSKWRNWTFFGIMSLVVLILIVEVASPLLFRLIEVLQ